MAEPIVNLDTSIVALNIGTLIGIIWFFINSSAKVARLVARLEQAELQIKTNKASVQKVVDSQNEILITMATMATKMDQLLRDSRDIKEQLKRKE